MVVDDLWPQFTHLKLLLWQFLYTEPNSTHPKLSNGILQHLPPFVAVTGPFWYPWPTDYIKVIGCAITGTLKWLNSIIHKLLI